MNVVLHYRASPGFRAALASLAPPWMRVTVIDEADRPTFLQALPHTDALLHVLEPVTAAMIAQAPRLKLIQKIGVGLNTIDLDAAAAAGIAVANMPGTNSQAVAEQALTLMLGCLRRIVSLDAAVRAGQGWSLPLTTFDEVGEIAGRTVGLIGFGEVPKRLAPVLAALGARVIAWSRTSFEHAAATCVPFDELIATADVISLHVPATPDTAGLLDARCFARMKRGVVIINTARGALIDEDALMQALESGHVAAAGLDVFQTEPVPPTHPLLQFAQVTVSPHSAWLTPETLRRSLSIAMENCRRLRAGEPLLHGYVPQPGGDKTGRS
jgi:phosphoglycerate dehydrogenase-like enzyme